MNQDTADAFDVEIRGIAQGLQPGNAPAAGIPAGWRRYFDAILWPSDYGMEHRSCVRYSPLTSMLVPEADNRTQAQLRRNNRLVGMIESGRYCPERGFITPYNLVDVPTTNVDPNVW